MTAEKTTALFDLHQSLGAKMVPFAGYAMPVQYQGVLAEHKHTRDAAGLFDVSHMGQCVLVGDEAEAQLQTLVPADLSALAINQQVYTVFTNEQGGIDDDLIVCRWAEDTFFIVVNAACKDADFAKLSALNACELRVLDEQALIALQGPKARTTLSKLAPEAATLTFMSGSFIDVLGHRCYVTCSGYTGEDGYEISCPNAAASDIAKTLLADDTIEPIGLGARDSLRLEAGLCLYGHDLDTSTTPVEASLLWAIPKSRRENGGYIGHQVIEQQLAEGASRKRVGLAIEGRAPVREGVTIVSEDETVVGKVTSGTFAPSLQRPIAMAYIATEALKEPLFALLRGKKVPISITAMPFNPQRYVRNV